MLWIAVTGVVLSALTLLVGGGVLVRQREAGVTQGKMIAELRANTDSCRRLEKTIHGEDEANGLKSAVTGIAAKVNAIDSRLEAVEALRVVVEPEIKEGVRVVVKPERRASKRRRRD